MSQGSELSTWHNWSGCTSVNSSEHGSSGLCCGIVGRQWLRCAVNFAPRRGWCVAHQYFCISYTDSFHMQLLEMFVCGFEQPFRPCRKTQHIANFMVWIAQMSDLNCTCAQCANNVLWIFEVSFSLIHIAIVHSDIVHLMHSMFAFHHAPAYLKAEPVEGRQPTGEGLYSRVPGGWTAADRRMTIWRVRGGGTEADRRGIISRVRGGGAAADRHHCISFQALSALHFMIRVV